MHKRCCRKPNKRKLKSNVSANTEQMIVRKSIQREVFAQGSLDGLGKFKNNHHQFHEIILN